jgi:cytochrome c5
VVKLKLVLVAFIITFAGSVSADHLKGHTIEKRIKPSGSVYVIGDDVPVSKPAIVAAASGPRSAEDIYNASCMACHATDAIGAPMFGNATSWEARIAKGEETLISNAINGFNAMPAMGACATCSKDDIKETVKYMVANSR